MLKASTRSLTAAQSASEFHGLAAAEQPAKPELSEVQQLKPTHGLQQQSTMASTSATGRQPAERMRPVRWQQESTWGAATASSGRTLRELRMP